MDKLLTEFVNTFDIALKSAQKKAGEAERSSRLTINQLQYIDIIHVLGQPTITEIAEKLGISKASVTVGVNKLETIGYVIKTRSTEDKRVCHVSTTEMSEKLIEAKYHALKEYGEFLDAALDREEAVQFRAALLKIVALFRQQAEERVN